ncbi:tetratricopeptide repeat protein [Aerosakkonemataceae cyanobacterium BLCC-F154]|uniref:Tetratricopeptide repeat protein n=1 Tax=Floridaenema fluviatile BLCC-F154 TaxID=3153640 RepID=A0ABV4YIX9_9CYAN
MEFKPDDHEAWHNRGVALVNLGKWEEAIDSYDKAIELKPDDHKAFYSKACCYALQNNANLAIQNLEQAINLNTDEYQKMAKTDTNFDSIRNDAGFQALMQE